MSEQTEAVPTPVTTAEVIPPVTAAPIETKPAEVVVPAEVKPEVKVEPAAVKPAEYALKLAEGSKLSASAIEEVSTLAKAKGYTPEVAQELLDQRQSAVNSYAEKQQQELVLLNDTTWKNELIADKEIGGAKFDENMILAHSAAEKWFGKEFAENLKAGHLNHNPRLVKGLFRIAKAGANDTHVQSANQAAGGKVPLEQQMYPNMFKTKESN